MKLKDYITEYVSSGRNTNKYGTFPFNDITIEDTIEWLDSIGIKGFSYHEVSDDPPVKPGEIVYYYGPCTKISSTHWIAVYNNFGHSGKEWTQELCIWTKDKKWRFTTNGEEPIEGDDMDKCIRLLDEMVNNPTKEIEI